MTPKKTLVGLMATASIMGGVDASTLNEVPLERIEIVATERVEAKQVGNKIETDFPWKDQAPIKVSYDMGEPTLAEKFKDQRNKEVITETVDFGDGGFKIDVLLNEKPDTNVFCYDIENAENYDFFYQPPLTAEEIAEGASRPPEIEGSYAVYHKTLANHELGKENYATGKVMHIPRPQVWELNNEAATKEWADMSYEDGQLCVTARQKFLDNANYPVRIDPTFGYTTAGASSATANNDQIFAVRDSSSSTDNGVVDSITFRVLNNTGQVKGLVINTSLQTILTNGISTATTSLNPQEWYTARYTTKPNIVAGTSYYSGFISNDASFTYYFDIGGVSRRFIDGTNSYTTPTDPTDGTTSNFLPSIYATYTTYPTVTTNPATSISSTTATLNGSLTDGSASTTGHGFAWGTDPTLGGGDTATTTLGATSTGAIYQMLSSLTQNTTYYFRAYAVNSAGTSTGSILNFKTTYVPSILKYLQMDGGLQVKGGVIIR
jgi:hypothetical protein